MNTVEILNQLSTENLKAKLNQYPSKIFEQKQVVRNAREAYNETEQDRAMREAELMSDIAAETNPSTGKAMYSNAETRQAELLKRKQTDQEYLIAARCVKEAESAMNQALDQLDMLFDEYKSLGYVSELVTSELKLWTNEPREVRPAA